MDTKNWPELLIRSLVTKISDKHNGVNRIDVTLDIDSTRNCFLSVEYVFLDIRGRKRNELRSRFDLTMNTVTNLFSDSVSVSIRVTTY